MVPSIPENFTIPMKPNLILTIFQDGLSSHWLVKQLILTPVDHLAIPNLARCLIPY